MSSVGSLVAGCVGSAAVGVEAETDAPASESESPPTATRPNTPPATTRRATTASVTQSHVLLGGGCGGGKPG